MADTQTPAATLDGPRLQGLLADFASTLGYASDRAQVEALRSALPCLLADAALLDRIEAVLKDASHGMRVEVARELDANDGYWYRVYAPRRRTIEAKTVREALSRALPEGGL